MEVLYQNLLNLDIKMIIMWLIGGVLIYLAVVVYLQNLSSATQQYQPKNHKFSQLQPIINQA